MLEDTRAVPHVELFVVGAHLTGQPLNEELLGCGAVLVGAAATAPTYRLWVLDTMPAKPGMLRVEQGGAAVQGELWRLAPSAFGAFVARLPAPMTIGPVLLSDGRRVPGFLVEPVAVDGLLRPLADGRAVDITGFGGWLAYLAARPLAPLG